MDDKKQSRWIPSSEGLCDCIRLQLERSDLIEIVLLLARPQLLQKHVDEFVNDSSLWHLPHVETPQAKNAKAMAEKSWIVAMIVEKGDFKYLVRFLIRNYICSFVWLRK